MIHRRDAETPRKRARKQCFSVSIGGVHVRVQAGKKPSKETMEALADVVRAAKRYLVEKQDL